MDLLQNVMAEIEPLVKGPIHLPAVHIFQTVVPAIAATMAVTTVIYVLSFSLAEKLYADITDPAKALEKKRQLCYQITNMSTNLCLGLTGLYYEYRLLPSNATTEEKAQGQEEFFIFASVQIGYQLWSLIVGTFFIKERIEMMFHHVAVINTAAMAGFFHNGFRYWTPYFFGIYELSSVLLGLMNVFKDNKAWIDAYPHVYTLIRILFALSFLTIRIVMLVPRLPYLRDVFLVPCLMDNEYWGVRLYYFLVSISCNFLFTLQIYWGYLIINGIVKMAKPKKEKKEKSKEQ